MGDHIRAARTPGARTAPTFAPPARGWTAAPAPVRAGAGHELSRIAVSAPGPAVGAPIQRVKWTWDDTNKRWNGPPGASNPPARPGYAHGEEFEDRFTLSSDATARPFLGSGESYFGEAAARLQAQGRTPSAAQVRVDSATAPDLRGGSGLHEVVPTSERGRVAGWRNPALIGAQSGFRASTAHQLFRRRPKPGEAVPPGGTEVGAHTGFARKPGGGSGSTHTSGQSAGHDLGRAAAAAVASTSDEAEVLNTIALEHYQATPTGPEVAESPYITGLLPTQSAIGAVEPVGPTPGPNRLALAEVTHEEREWGKLRARSYKRETGRGRSPSPPRLPLGSGGGGGGYVQGDRTTWPLVNVPSFPGKPGSWEHAADAAGWLSQVHRHGHSRGPRPLSLAAAVAAASSGGTPTPAAAATTTTTSSAPPPVITPSVPAGGGAPPAASRKRSQPTPSATPTRRSTRAVKRPRKYQAGTG